MKTLQQVQWRILNLRSRVKDWLNVQDEIDVLEEIEDFYEASDEDIDQMLIETALEYLWNREYKKSRITIWALE